MAIQLVKEPKQMEVWGIENCFFECGNTTRYWHAGTNQPVCKDCAKKHKTCELKKSHKNYKPLTKKEYLK